jgi:hypothetical protein
LTRKLDCNFRSYHQTRTERIRDRGKRVVDTLPGAAQAARELCLELAEYLSQRYPDVYEVERRQELEGSWFGEPNEIRKIAIPAFGVSYDLDEEDSMTVAGLLVPDDLAIMMEGSDSKVWLHQRTLQIDELTLVSVLSGSWSNSSTRHVETRG